MAVNKQTTSTQVSSKQHRNQFQKSKKAIDLDKEMRSNNNVAKDRQR